MGLVYVPVAHNKIPQRAGLILLLGLPNAVVVDRPDWCGGIGPPKPVMC